jgi:hypothetical protein
MEGVRGNNAFQFDGESWSPLGDGYWLYNGPSDITEFDSDGDGITELYFAGSIMLREQGPVLGIIRWDGTRWDTIGGGLEGNTQVESVGVYDDGNGPRLYVSGRNIEIAFGVTTGLVMFDGQEWVRVGEGVTGNADELSPGIDPLTGDHVLFFTATGTSTSPGFEGHGLAAWDGQQFIDVAPFIGGCDEIVMYQGDVYVAGEVSTFGGVNIGTAARWDGVQWGSLGLPTQSSPFFRRCTSMVTFDDGSGEALYVSSTLSGFQGLNAQGLARWDGTQWTEVGDAATREPLARTSSMAVCPFKGAPALWVANDEMHVWDGGAWHIRNYGIGGRGSGTGGEPPVVRTMKLFDDRSGAGQRLFVGGEFTLAGPVRADNVAAWDGEQWSALGSGVQGVVYCMQTFDDGSGEELYAGRYLVNASPVLRWDGAQWNEVGPPVGDVRDMLVMDTPRGPRLVASGWFTVDGVLRSVMQWDGREWTPLGTAFNGRVYCLAVYDDGSGPALYAGGRFTMCGSTPINSIAKWDGTSWHGLGAGIVSYWGSTAYVFCMAVYEGGPQPVLVVGGQFTTSNGVHTYNIAQWNGESFAPMAAGLNETAYTLMVGEEGLGGEGILFAAGHFGAAGGDLSARGVARWNGHYWQALPAEQRGGPNGLGGNGLCLEVFPYRGRNYLAIGGYFDEGGDYSAENFTMWRGCDPQVPTFPPCRYEVIRLSNDPVYGYDLEAFDLSNNTRSLANHLGQYSVPDALFTWDEPSGLVPVTLPAGSSRPYARAMNDAGNFAASVSFQVGSQQIAKGAINVGQTWSIVEPLQPTGYSVVYALNIRNVAVGMRGPNTAIGSEDQGFIWENGEATPLLHPNSLIVRPRDINDHDTIVGLLEGPDVEQPFAWAEGAFVNLPMLPDAIWPSVNAVNNLGQAVGSMRFGMAGGYTVPVLWDSGVVHELPILPGGGDTYVYDINDAGIAVGRSAGLGRAVLWRDGKIIDLNQYIQADIFISLNAAYAINEAGEILCDAYYPVVLRPVQRMIGDVNSDCVVDAYDLTLVILEWGQADSPADVNDDGVVDADDLIAVILSWS